MSVGVVRDFSGIFDTSGDVRRYSVILLGTSSPLTAIDIVPQATLQAMEV